jgi:hypothetical protein
LSIAWLPPCLHWRPTPFIRSSLDDIANDGQRTPETAFNHVLGDTDQDLGVLTCDRRVPDVFFVTIWTCPDSTELSLWEFTYLFNRYRQRACRRHPRWYQHAWWIVRAHPTDYYSTRSQGFFSTIYLFIDTGLFDIAGEYTAVIHLAGCSLMIYFDEVCRCNTMLSSSSWASSTRGARTDIHTVFDTQDAPLVITVVTSLVHRVIVRC